MKIPPIQNRKNYQYNPSNINFKAVIFENFNPNYDDNKETLKKELEEFSKNSKNARFLGAGLSAKAYILQKLPNFVMKEAYNANETFEQEHYNMVWKVGCNYNSPQKFVARAFDDDLGKYYLITTKVSGATPNPETAPFTSKHLENLFDKLYQLDTNGIYHGDLNLGNIKLTADGNVDFIDFQWTQNIYESRLFEDNSAISHPSFLMCENLQMLEMSGMPNYLKKIENKEEREEFFFNYLKAKSIYHKRRADFIESKIENWPYSAEIPILEKALVFEKAQAEVLKNPNDDIRNLEILKMQFLSSFRQAYKFVDENIFDKNILQGASAYLLTLMNIKNLKVHLDLYSEKNESGSPYFKDYILGLEAYADYWFDNIDNWSSDTFMFPIRHINKPLLRWEDVRYDFANSRLNHRKFQNMLNLVDVMPMIYDYQTRLNMWISPTTNLQAGLIGDLKTTGINLREINKIENIEYDNRFLNNDKIKNDLKELNYLKNKILQLYQSKRYFNVLDNALLGMLLSNQTKKELQKLNNYYLTNTMSSLEKNEETYEALAREVFLKIKEDINLTKCISKKINHPEYNVYEQAFEFDDAE